jgi:hypothetical protein
VAIATDHPVEADRKLAEQIATALRIDGWDSDRAEALITELEQAIQWQRGYLPHSLDVEAEKERRERIRQSRENANRRAEAYEAAIQSIQESPSQAVSHLLGIRGRVIDSNVDGFDRARVDPFPLMEDLRKLAQGERFIAKRATDLLRERKHTADDILVGLIADLLFRHGVRPTAYPVPSSSAATGNLVTACAMMRNEQPTTASWVVKAAVRLRAQRRAEPHDSRPNPWE